MIRKKIATVLFLLAVTTGSLPTAAQVDSPVEPPIEETTVPPPEPPERPLQSTDAAAVLPATTDGSAGSPVAAGESGSSATVLFHWADPTPDWSLGGLYAGLGLAGALVTLFALIGGAIPGTDGTARIDAESQRLETFYARLVELTNEPVLDAAAISALNDTVDKLRDDLTQERWRLFAMGFVLYALLGSFFAMALARDYVQALVVGAGWTGVIGSLGLKSEFTARKQIKDKVLDDVQSMMPAVGNRGHVPDSPAAEILAGTEFGTWGRVQEEIRMAKAV